MKNEGMEQNPNGKGLSNLNRKATKIEYLSQENAQLKEENQELLTMLRLNKEALRISMNGIDAATTISSKDGIAFTENQPETTVKLRNNDQRNNHADNPKALNMILHSLYEENATLTKKIDRITEERNVAQSKAFINEQISEASQKHERELIAELEDKVKHLTSKLRETEKTIHQLERCTPEYEQLSGIVIKYRDVISISESTKVMHDEMEKLNVIIGKQLKIISDYKSDRQDLLRLNMSLSNEIIKLKSMLSANSYGQQRLTLPESSNAAAAVGPNPATLMKFHQKMNKNPSDDELDDDEEYSFEQLPDKCEKYAQGMKLQTEMGTVTQPNIGSGGGDNLATPSAGATAAPAEQSVPTLGISIPKLDLTKARQIMDLNAKKSTQQQQMKEAQQQQGNVLLYIEKIKKIEKDLEVVRINLSREMLLNKTLTIQNEGFKRANAELESRNEILINSHSMFEEKWTKIVNAFEFYKDFYQKHIDFQSGRKESKSPRLSAPLSDNDNSYDAERIMKIKNLSMQSGPLSMQQITRIPSQIKKTLLQLNQDDYRLDDQSRRQQLALDGAYSKSNARDYMIQMAKGLNEYIEKTGTEKLFHEMPQQQGIDSPDIQAKHKSSGKELQLTSTTGQPRLKRSFSNTLDYVNQQQNNFNQQQLPIQSPN